MSKKLFVVNLSPTTTLADIQSLFSEYGTVESVNLIKDPMTGKFKGEAIVTMANAAADAAVMALDGRTIQSRVIRVNVAND